MDKPFPPSTRALGKESLQLFVIARLRLRHHLLAQV
jgi:hypothetical protein